MKKVYLVYATIPYKIFIKIKYMLPKIEKFKSKGNNMVGLYAWTTNKEYVEEFLEIRNNSIYTVKKVDIEEKGELKSIKDNYGTSELKPYEYYLDSDDKDSEHVDIISTKNEFVCSTIDSEEYLFDFGPSVEEEAPYVIFNDDIIEALDVLGYTDKYDLSFGDSEKVDLVSYNNSFGVSVMERSKIKFTNQMNILLYLFSFFFYGR